LSTLADRIRGIVGGGDSVSRPSEPVTPNGGRVPDTPILQARDLSVLGGEWCAGANGACFIVEHHWNGSARHGRESIGTLAERLDAASADAALFAGGSPAPPPFVFFDLETTGLHGGAGTLAFLVGCGSFDGSGGFVTRQFLMTEYADEQRVLERVAAEFERAGALVSFNGKSFDAPLLETRFLFHRLKWMGADIPHVDVLHPARRFWNRHGVGPQDGCSLQTLERQIVGMRRSGDVPGFEIPRRYFDFVRSRDARPLAAVLEHNRLDLLTLAALTARLLHLARSGPADIADAREVLALGIVYARAGFDERARTCWRLAVERCRSPKCAYDPIRIEALRLLALAWRRARRFDEAAECWSWLLEIRGCPQPLEREATAALAIHHEHRRRDLAAAKVFALRNLESAPAPVWKEAARYRLARLERKMSTESMKFEV
jgi:uncharacterized protein YprB with RNaseH-like and TPR domain